MRRRIATIAACAAALLLVPATAPAAESVSVTGGVLQYVGGAATVDTVTVAPGPTGSVLVSDTTTPYGVPGTGCAYYALYTLRCFGATSAVLDALDGDDRITLTADLPFTVRGGDGADTILGGPTTDAIDAGDGADVIDVRGGGADTVDCGPGADSIEADAGVDVLTNCDLPLPKEPVEPPVEPPEEPVVEPVEPVEPEPGPAHPTGSDELGPGSPVEPAQAAPPPPAAVRPTSHGIVNPVLLAIHEEIGVGAEGVATFELQCPATEADGACDGSVFLDPAPRAKGRPLALAARRGRYGRSRFDVPAGKTAKVKLKLTASARRALALPKPGKARAARRGRRVKSVVTVAEKGKKPAKKKVKLHR